jgi:hypothetical protein
MADIKNLTSVCRDKSSSAEIVRGKKVVVFKRVRGGPFEVGFKGVSSGSLVRYDLCWLGGRSTWPRLGRCGGFLREVNLDGRLLQTSVRVCAAHP